MSTERPTVAPGLIAALIESTPDLVRRRLDRTPDAAASWDWQANPDAWSVIAGGETVTLPHGHLALVEQLACTCLLSPRCFHVLACLTRLDVVLVESQPAEHADQVLAEKGHTDQDHVNAEHSAASEPSTLDAGEDVVEPEEQQQHAARELVNSVAQLLRVGVANAGVVVQSGLLRAVHQCRADGLHRLAAIGLRVIAGTSEFRARAQTSDPPQLAEDIADVLETSSHILRKKPIASFWIGTARHRQLPVRPRKLHGIFAEPIVTRSGFAGAAAYFLGEDDRIYTASDVRPGEAHRARDAYLGGIEIGPLIQPAKQLARGLYVGTDLTASLDGRLGRGKAIKLVEQGPSTWQTETIQRRFRRPLADQWNAVYAQTAHPADARPAGWDFVFVEGTVQGAAGPELLFEVTTDRQQIRLAIENESVSLFFRENLRMLSHAPGLRLQIIARVNLQDPRIVSPLAVAPVAGDSPSDNAPRLNLPQSFAARICLGFDELQRQFLLNAQASAVVLSLPGPQQEQADPLSALRRRWIATMLAGLMSQRASHRNLLATEMATLNRIGFGTAAALLDALASAPPITPGLKTSPPSAVETFWAAGIYLRSCTFELARSRATLGN